MDSLETPLVKFEGDSLFSPTIALEEVVIFKNLQFDNYKDRVRYRVLKRKTLKVYPYAKLAAERLVKLNQRLASLKSKRAKKRYTKKVQKYIEEEFTEELKKLTRTEGQILVKLMYRQNGLTVFNLVKDLRSGWKAFWYNNTAKLFKISLKKEYDPTSNHEDYLIEGILQRAFADGVLQPQETALDFDYFNLQYKWKGQQVPHPVKFTKSKKKKKKKKN
ncbi:MAG: DUF4294 domain-containing protein [Flavobacteriaceae bacterium]|nr:DUF4294 domain-containing protein [Flavobacteriaceae bacterium]